MPPDPPLDETAGTGTEQSAEIMLSTTEHRTPRLARPMAKTVAGPPAAPATPWHTGKLRAIAARNGSSDGHLEQRARGRALTSVVVQAGGFNQVANILNNPSVTEIRLAAGTYEATSTLTISRSVTITADVEGASVVLDGQGSRIVISISGGTVQLVGLSITNGYNQVRPRPRLHSTHGPSFMAPRELASWN